MKNILKFALIAAMPMVFASCLKDKNVEDQVYGLDGAGNSKTVTFPAAPEVTNALELSATNTTIDLVKVRLAAAAPADHDIQVTLVKDDALVTAAGYTPAPANTYTINSYVVTIPKGSREAGLSASVSTTLLFAGDYSLGFRIVSISDASYTVASNFNTIIVALPVKNRYDGRYIGKGYGFLGTANTTAPYLFSWGCDEEIDLVTINATTVQQDYQPLPKNGGLVYYTGVGQRFVFDLATNKVAAMTATTMPSAISVQFPVDGGTYDSRYDDATKTVYAKFGYNGSATWRVIDTLTYCAPRP